MNEDAGNPVAITKKKFFISNKVDVSLSGIDKMNKFIVQFSKETQIKLKL